MLRRRSNEFENEIQEGFAAVREHTGAWLYWVNPPVVPCGVRGKMPVFAMTGPAMFDLGGWTHQDFSKTQAIGVELKSTKKYKSNLPIIGLDKKGSGLQYHQIEALAALHREGHIAGVLWNNGGSIGVLKGEAINAAFIDYMTSVTVEEAGGRPAKGSRSISWSKFNMVIGTGPEAWYLENFHIGLVSQGESE
jgi:hypothetical protein